jgi:subtilase family serine protease
MFTNFISSPCLHRIWGWLAACAVASPFLAAQAPAPRIRSEISNSQMSPVKGSSQPLSQRGTDAGRMPADSRVRGMSIVFGRSAAQQADLEALIASQRDPSSPLFHQWLTPDQFANRFGMAQSDIQKVQAWLEQQGFAVDSVARSRTFIRFSGNVNQVEQAFRTEMHYYKVDGQQRFAPSTELSVPAAMAPTIHSIRNLSDFRPRPMHARANIRRPKSAFTSGVSGSVFFTPADIATVYNLKPLYSGGINGAGQSIAVVGQSGVTVSDIQNFQKAAGLTVKDPTLVLVPGTGSSTIFSGGDEAESELDLEWAGAIAPGADLYFVYTGGSTNYSAFDSIVYSIDERIASIISISYGACETALNGFSLESSLAQAAAQGQSVVAASGDQGSTACSGDTSNGLTQDQQFGMAVNYPASSPYVTGIGGTEISADNSTSTNSTYWLAQSTSDVLSSAKTYIPELAWNDGSAQSGLSASGGGASALFDKPAWQKGVPGIPNDSKRDVPDIAVYSSPAFPGFLYCTSDQSSWNTEAPAQQASCNDGFRDSATTDLTVAGGTSFGAPIFAGTIALLNQKAGYVNGQGLVNPTLYALASDSATYASVFHDVTSGNNNCNAGSTYCGTTTTGFKAGTGYDQVTGLGSVDADSLASAWPVTSSTLIGTKTTITATTTTPDVNKNDTFTIAVTSQSGTTTPTGTLIIDLDGGTIGGGTTVTGLTLTASGTYAYTTQFATAGSHQIVAKYSGDSTHAPSTGLISVTVSGTSSGSGTFAVAGSNVTVAQGSSENSTITVTPKDRYTGTVYLTFSTSNDAALSNLCYAFTTMLSNGDGSVTVSGTAPVTTQMQFDTRASDCVSSAATQGNAHPLHKLRTVKTSRNSMPHPGAASLALAGLLVVGFLGRNSRKLRSLSCVFALALVGLYLSACGGSVETNPNTNNPPNPPKGTYTITLTGTDSVTSSVTSQSTFTLVIN